MNNSFNTKNLNLAAFLYASGISLVQTSQENFEITFSLEPKDKAEKLVKDYYLGKALVNPQDLFARLNDLRDIVFSRNQGDG